jgi:hypothetical protein
MRLFAFEFCLCPSDHLYLPLPVYFTGASELVFWYWKIRLSFLEGVPSRFKAPNMATVLPRVSE